MLRIFNLILKHRDLEQLYKNPIKKLNYQAAESQEFIKVIEQVLFKRVWLSPEYHHGLYQHLLYLSDENYCLGELLGCIRGDKLFLNSDYFYRIIQKLSEDDMYFNSKSKKMYYRELFFAGILKLDWYLHFNILGRRRIGNTKPRFYFCIQTDLLKQNINRIPQLTV